MQRRCFIQSTAAAGAGFLLLPGLADSAETRHEKTARPGAEFYRQARYYEKLQDGIVECRLCPRRCRVSDLERGYCGVRENIGGEYYTSVYSRVCSANVDPIEKKPFFHYFPGTFAFSIATAGCNLNCRFCQNWSISQFRPEDIPAMNISPLQCVRQARESGCLSIAYTYSEPTVFYEYMFDCAVEGKKAGIKSVLVSAGFIEKEPLERLLEVIDAVKIDLKSFSDDYYRRICNGKLQPVLDTLLTIKSRGVWLEIVYLVVPGFNDTDKELIDLCGWLAANLGPDVPVHFTRFHPAYLMNNIPMTPKSTLEKATAIARAEGIHYPYIGNVFGHQEENTRCHKCGRRLILRSGFQIVENEMQNGRCPDCRIEIPGIWS